MRDAAFGCDWVGTAIPFQRCLTFVTAAANKELQLTAGKFVPVSNLTMMNVCMYACIVCIVGVYLRVYIYIFIFIFENVKNYVLLCN